MNITIKEVIIYMQLERSFQRFTSFYSGQHSGRKLNWLYQMSKGELATNCFKNRYTLQVLIMFSGFITAICRLCTAVIGLIYAFSICLFIAFVEFLNTP